PTMRVNFEGELPQGVTAKDVMLALISRYGATGGSGYAIEYAGGPIRAMGMDGRMTLCNLSIEFGAKWGLIAVDETTIAFAASRPYSATGAMLGKAVEDWRTLKSDDGAVFDREITLDVSGLVPQVSWGTSPEHTVDITANTPELSATGNESVKDWESAYEYMGLAPGTPISGVPVDHVFIGSCTNSRLDDLRAAAAIARGRTVAPNVVAWVVPGSRRTQREAVAEGLDKVFRDAGFQWREPGCSMCAGTNGDMLRPGQRCLSTSNRNFVGRQGEGVRTHLASPATAAATAIAGVIADPRQYSPL
ncbi:MAG: 3-isopropylmalate dehydratase, partial [Comamonadaceae bacterium]